jgi:glycosyltransferase involved in cell wall biosynthesis
VPSSPAVPTEPLRIAAVTCNLLLGGATTFLLNLQRALAGTERRLRVVAVTERNEHAADFAALGTDLHARGLSELIYEDRLAWAYARLAEYRPGAVLACLGAESYEMLRLVPPGVARIGLIQSDDPAPYEMARHYAPWLDAMVGVSEGIAEKLRAMPEFRAVRVEAIPYGIAFPPPRPRIAAVGPLRVIYLGRLLEVQKRISRLVELIDRLPGEEFHFTIAGSGPEEAQFRAAVARCGNVTLLGAVPNAEIASLLERQDALVLLSDFEGLPLSLLEAMGAGVVPVVSDLAGGLREAIPPECGVRVPVGDVAAAAEALRGLAVDRARLASLSAAAALRTRRLYSADTMAERYVGLIRGVGARSVDWPAQVQIPAPLGVPAWQFQGWPRRVRRLLKKHVRR